MKRFAYGILAGMAVIFGGLIAAYTALSTLWPNNLAAPAISPMAALDLKLRFLRNAPTLDPHVLAVGSSIALHQLDGSAFESVQSGSLQVLNGATVNLKIHQTRDLLEFYLAHYRNVGTVLVLVSPPDFDDCSDQPARVFDHADAAAYVFRRWPEPYFYLRYFAPQRYAEAVWTFAARQVAFSGDLFLDRHGTSPLHVPDSMKRGLRYGSIQADPACLDALMELANGFSARVRRLVIVFAPLHPDYRENHPEVVRWLRDAAARVEAEAKINGTHVVRLYDHPDFVAADFFDALHLQWPSAKRLSALIARAMGGTTRRVQSSKQPRV